VGHVLKDLVEAAQAGDKKALRDLIDATQGRLYKFCFVLCGDPVRAEDLCQEAYLKVFNSLSKLTKPESFFDWLFRITRHLYIDQIRATREQATAELPEASVSGEQAEALAVHQTLSQFEPEDRWLLVLVDMEQYTYAEAAEMMGLSEAAVRSRLFRIRKIFVEKWQDRETK